LTIVALSLAVVAAALVSGTDARLRALPDEALLERAAAQPDNAHLQKALARRLRERGERTAAVYALERALDASSPEDLSVRRELAETLFQLGRGSDALQHVREIAQRNPTDPFAQERLGEFYLSEGAVSWAVEAFEHVVAARPRDGQAWASLATGFLQMNQAEKALHAFERACALAPHRPEYELGRGRAAMDAGDEEAAEAAFRRALEAGAGGQAAYWLGVLYFAAGERTAARDEEAARWLTEARRLSPHAVEPLLALGRMKLRTREPEATLALLEEAAALAPDHLEVIYLQAQAYRELGRHAEARPLLERFESISEFDRERRHLEVRLTQAPDDASLLRRLADLYARHGDHTRAAALASRITTSSADRPSPNERSAP
jgi:tetratricopeptide (TPR) repeat protein